MGSKYVKWKTRFNKRGVEYFDGNDDDRGFENTEEEKNNPKSEKITGDEKEQLELFKC